MKYFYLTAEGTTAGPHSLVELSAMAGGGSISLATLVAPAGGADWTPLARVLRYFYQEAGGAAAGPVAFSELSRLNQVGALPADAWVVEEDSAAWKPLAAVLTAGGASVTAPAPAPRTVAPVFHPQAAESHRTHGGARVRAGHGRPAQGIARMPFIVFLVLLLALAVLAVMAVGFDFRKSIRMSPEDWRMFWDKHYTVLLICGGILVAGVSVLSVLRLRNIGWPWPFVFLWLLPPASLWLGIVLASYPPRFARTRRYDLEAKIIAGVLVGLLVAGALATMVFWPDIEKEWKAREEKPASEK
jgi:hypothetical protein